MYRVAYIYIFCLGGPGRLKHIDYIYFLYKGLFTYWKKNIAKQIYNENFNQVQFLRFSSTLEQRVNE